MWTKIYKCNNRNDSYLKKTLKLQYKNKFKLRYQNQFSLLIGQWLIPQTATCFVKHETYQLPATKIILNCMNTCPSRLENIIKESYEKIYLIVCNVHI